MKCPFQTITTTEVTKNVLVKGLVNRRSDVTRTTVSYAECVGSECPYYYWSFGQHEEVCKRVKDGDGK